MIHPVPKPPPKQKKRKPLRTKSRLKSKAKIPANFKNAVLERDDYTCQRCGRYTKDTPHHIIFQSQGRNTDWIHDQRNGVTLCWTCHRLAHDYDKWRRYWERWGVKRFGWLGGQAMTLEEYEELRKLTKGGG